MKNTLKWLIFGIILGGASFSPRFGWRGHEMINQHAIHVLPTELNAFYKQHVAYILAHTNDPDKRRMVSETEGFRHYFDADGYKNVPKDVTEAAIVFVPIFVIMENGKDTLELINFKNVYHKKRDYFIKGIAIRRLFGRDSIAIADTILKDFYRNNVLQNLENSEFSIISDSLQKMFQRERLAMKKVEKVFAKDHLSRNGMLPFHCQMLYRRLVKALTEKNERHILRLSAELGHYVADACVPLHTTKNYDGQLTNQRGIHRFWETRLVENDAENFDFMVGKANYLPDSRDFFWKLVEESHNLVPAVLDAEKRARQNILPDKMFSPYNKNGTTIVQESDEWCAAFERELGDMIENCVRRATISVASVWYSAWVEAGQPNLTEKMTKNKLIIEKDTFPSVDNPMLGRKE